jgi:hypothetical protein
MKLKKCETCSEEVDTAYRIQIKKGKLWVFVCAVCLPVYQAGNFYSYGGTWKGYRH